MLVAVCALAWTAPAFAKELAAVKVCGAVDCTPITSHAVLRPLIHAIEAQGDAVTVRTPAPAAFLRLEYYLRGHRHGDPDFTHYYAPTAGRLAIETDPGAWAWVDGATAFALPVAWLVRRRRRH